MQYLKSSECRAASRRPPARQGEARSCERPTQPHMHGMDTPLQDCSKQALVLALLAFSERESRERAFFSITAATLACRCSTRAHGARRSHSASVKMWLTRGGLRTWYEMDQYSTGGCWQVKERTGGWSEFPVRQWSASSVNFGPGPIVLVPRSYCVVVEHSRGDRCRCACSCTLYAYSTCT